MFTNAIENFNNSAMTTTENGALAHATTGSALVEFFYQVPASRTQDIKNSTRFEASLIENTDLAIKALLWLRDIRGGAGERQTFKVLLNYLGLLHPDIAKRVFKKVPEFGRWDDLFALVGTPIEAEALAYCVENISNGLCAKWMPRQGKIAYKLRTIAGLSARDWRKLLVKNTKVVETQMCKNKWGDITYSHVPSVASAMYRKAFSKHDADRYKAYLAGVLNGTQKINASAVFPHDVLPSSLTGGRSPNGMTDAILAQWANLPNYIGEKSILPMIDVSGSMETLVPSTKHTALHIAMSLGLYCADKCTGPFHGAYLNFSTKPVITNMKGNVVEECLVMNRTNWSQSTDINRAFKLVLDMAVQNNLKDEDMPKAILILSDMEFNEACHRTATNFEAMELQYAQVGYTLPKIIFWNLASRSGHAPVQKNTKNTILISGFSPTVLKAALKGNEATPLEVILDLLMSDRYNW